MQTFAQLRLAAYTVMQTAALRCAQVRAQVRENHVHYQRDITKELQELEAFENHVLYERNMATRAKMRCNIVRLLKLVKVSMLQSGLDE